MMEEGRKRQDPPYDLPATGRDDPQETNRRNMLKIKQLHDEAYLYIEHGLSCDEKGQTEQAVTLYTKGIRCMDLAFDVPMEAARNMGAEDQKGRNLLRKMQGTKRQIQSRVENLIQYDAHVVRSIMDPPPTYEEATTPTRSPEDVILDDFLMCEASGSDSAPASATELFKIDDGVQIFYITKEGYVSAPSYPSKLGVYKFDESVTSSNGTELAQVFLRVGDWTYPLLAGQSPVLHANWGAYVFPDVTASDDDGNAVGLIIPDYISPVQRAKFEQIMNKYTFMRDQEFGASNGHSLSAPEASQPVLPPGECDYTHLEKEPTSSKISRGIETAAEWISWGLIKGAEKTGELVKKGSAKLQQNMRPEIRAVQVDPRTQKGLYYTRKATEGVVQVSAYLVTKLGQGTMYLARKAAPQIRQQGEKYLPTSMVQKNQAGQSKLDGALEVAAGGLKGWATVYVGLEQAAMVLAKNIADETVHVVKHKYGAEAGEVTENTLYSGGNLALTVHHSSSMGATAIAKRVAKDTGRAVADDVKRPRGGSNTQTNGANMMDYGDKSTELRDS